MKRAVLAGTVLAVAGIAPAQAQTVVEAPRLASGTQAPVAAASGWYLRGDVGYSWNRLRGADYFQGSNATYVPFATASLRDSYSIGGGVGYKTSGYMRFDLTGDYFSRAEFRGSTVGSCGVAVSCVSTDISNLRALSLLANAYVDVFTHGRFTAYAGAGIGGTRVSWGEMRNTSCDVTDPGNCDPTVVHGGYSSWRFTYALMAGATVDINCALKADVGYRYRNASAGGRMFGYALGGGPGYDRGFSSHEVRGGLRYTFGGCGETVVYDPPVYDPPVYK